MLLDNVLGCVPTFSELWSTLHNARLDRLVDSENEDLVQWRWSCVSKAHNKTMLATGRLQKPTLWISHFVNSNRIRKSKVWTQENINSPKHVNILAKAFCWSWVSYWRTSIVTFLPVLLITVHLISNSSLLWKACQAVDFYAFRTLFVLASYTFLSGFCQLGWYFLLFTVIWSSSFRLGKRLCISNN